MVKIFTDGSSRGNPGKGGFGVVAMKDDVIIWKYSGYCEKTTNNCEELKAIALGIAYAILHEFKEDEYTIYSDSAYCINMIKDWMWTWAKNDWKNSKNVEIKNKPIVLVIYSYLKQLKYNDKNFQKIAGHANIAGNELADALAKNDNNKFKKYLKIYNIVDNSDNKYRRF
jgi:ribonuclease HI